jgi:hypothetical protein
MQRLIIGMNDEEGNLTDLSDLTDLVCVRACWVAMVMCLDLWR